MRQRPKPVELQRSCLPREAVPTPNICWAKGNIHARRKSFAGPRHRPQKLPSPASPSLPSLPSWAGECIHRGERPCCSHSQGSLQPTLLLSPPSKSVCHCQAWWRHVGRLKKVAISAPGDQTMLFLGEGCDPQLGLGSHTDL